MSQRETADDRIFNNLSRLTLEGLDLDTLFPTFEEDYQLVQSFGEDPVDVNMADDTAPSGPEASVSAVQNPSVPPPVPEVPTQPPQNSPAPAADVPAPPVQNSPAPAADVPAPPAQNSPAPAPPTPQAQSQSEEPPDPFPGPAFTMEWGDFEDAPADQTSSGKNPSKTPPRKPTNKTRAKLNTPADSPQVIVQDPKELSKIILADYADDDIIDPDTTYFIPGKDGNFRKVRDTKANRLIFEANYKKFVKSSTIKEDDVAFQSLQDQDGDEKKEERLVIRSDQSQALIRAVRD